MTTTTIAPPPSISHPHVAPNRPTTATSTAPPPSRPPRPPRADRRVTFHLTATVSVTVPAIRMLAIVASATGQATDHELVPIVALESRVVREYSRLVPIGRSAPTAPDHADLIEGGWSFEGESVERDALVVDPEMGIQPATELYDDVCNIAYRVAACPWPESEDEERLSAAIKKTQAEALERETRWRAGSGAEGRAN